MLTEIVVFDGIVASASAYFWLRSILIDLCATVLIGDLDENAIVLPKENDTAACEPPLMDPCADNLTPVDHRYNR